MPFFQKNIISAHVIKSKSDKLSKRALRDARRKIKKGELIDSHSLALYLKTIDARYIHLKTEVLSSTRVVDYAKIRATKIAETRELLVFFDQDKNDLDILYRSAAKKAQDAGQIDDLKQQTTNPIDLTRLKNILQKLTKEED